MKAFVQTGSGASDVLSLVDIELPLADLPAAQDRLDANDVIGKIVLHP